MAEVCVCCHWLPEPHKQRHAACGSSGWNRVREKKSLIRLKICLSRNYTRYIKFICVNRNSLISWVFILRVDPAEKLEKCMKSNICPLPPDCSPLALKRSKIKFNFLHSDFISRRLGTNSFFISFDPIFYTSCHYTSAMKTHPTFFFVFCFFNFIAIYFSVSWLMVIWSDINIHKSAWWHRSVFFCIDLKLAGISASWLSCLRINGNMIGEKGLLTLIKKLGEMNRALRNPIHTQHKRVWPRFIF